MSFFRRFFSFIVKYIFFSILLAILAYGYTLMPKRQKENAILVVHIEDTELKDYDQGINLFSKKGHSVVGLSKLIKSAARDPKIKGLVLRLHGSQMGLGQVDEIKYQLDLLKKNKKPIFVFADSLGKETNNTGTAAYLLASYADFIYINPIGIVNINGLLASRYFLKELLDHYAIKGTIEKRDEYKGIADVYMFNGFSKPVRDNLESVLQSNLNFVIQQIAVNRKLSTDQAKSLIDNAPFIGIMAVKEKLVDEAVYFDENMPPEPLKKLMEETKSKFVSAKKYPLYPEDKQKDKIAIVCLSGMVTRYSPDALPFEKAITDFAVEKMVKRIIQEKYKAVFFRINTGGGDPVASENIYNSIQQLHHRKIPVLTSMSDLCASGGYYMASATDYIIAHPTTITGSIGAAFIKPYLKEFAKKFNINFDSIGVGANAAFFSFVHDLTDKQKEQYKSYVDQLYNVFLDRVVTDRKIDKDKLKNEIAGGRVWSGLQAKELGLVDELGGIDAAVKKAADLAKLAEYQVVTLPTGGIADLIADLKDSGISSKILSQCLVQIKSMFLEMSQPKFVSQIEFKE